MNPPIQPELFADPAHLTIEASGEELKKALAELPKQGWHIETLTYLTPALCRVKAFRRYPLDIAND